MTCREFEPLAAAFADGALFGAESERAGAHVAACPGCRKSVERQRAIARRLKAIKVQVPRRLEVKVHRLIDALVPRRRRLLALAASVGGLGVAAALVARWGRVDLVATAIRHHRIAASGEAAQIPAAELAETFAAAGFPRGRGFADLSPDARLERGGIFDFDGARATLALYETRHGPVTCQMFPNGAPHLPDVPVLERAGLELRTVRRRGLGVVLWRDGTTVCALVGALSDETLLQLAVREASA